MPSQELGARVGALPPGYAHLLDRVTAVCSADERVRALWVHGSVARGEADADSDLDVIAAVADDALEAFGDDWRGRIDAITPTVMARRFPGPGGSLLTITPGGERLDMWIEAAGDVSASVVRDRMTVFDRDGLDASVPPRDPPAGPSPEKFASLRAWDAAVRAVAAGADELLALEVTHALRWILYEAYVETNRPLPHTALKRWSSKLTPEQRARFDVLPTGTEYAPVMAALDEVLGVPVMPLPEPVVGRAVLPPEGWIRALYLPDEPIETRARHVAEEFLAIHLYLPLVVHREDWLLGLDGVALLRKLLYELDLEENGRTPARSPADWSGRLTSEQRDEILALPTGDATRDGVIDAIFSLRATFFERGRRILGDQWPAAMERTVIDHVDAGIRLR
jgi:hypothetical protein